MFYLVLLLGGKGNQIVDSRLFSGKNVKTYVTFA